MVDEFSLFVEIMPYMSNYEKIKDFLSRLKNKDINEIITALENLLEVEESKDPTIFTDIKIIIDYLKKK